MPADASKKWDPVRHQLYQWYCVDGLHMDEIRRLLQEQFNLKAKERTLHNQFRRWEFPSRRPESIHEIPRLLPLVKEMYKKDYTSKEMTTCLREKYGIDVTERQLKSLRLRHQLFLKSGPACRVRHIIPLEDVEMPTVDSSEESIDGSAGSPEASQHIIRRPRAPAAQKLSKKARKTQLSTLPHDLILHLFQQVDSISTVRSLLLTSKVFNQVFNTTQNNIYGLAASKEFASLATSVLDLWRPGGLPQATRNFMKESSEFTIGMEDPDLSPHKSFIGTAEARRLNEDKKLVKYWLGLLEQHEQEACALRSVVSVNMGSAINVNAGTGPQAPRGIIRHIDVFGKMSETERARLAECIYHILHLAASIIPLEAFTNNDNDPPTDAIFINNLLPPSAIVINPTTVLNDLAGLDPMHGAHSYSSIPVSMAPVMSGMVTSGPPGMTSMTTMMNPNGMPHPSAPASRLLFLPDYLFSLPIKTTLRILSAMRTLSPVWSWAKVLRGIIGNAVTERILAIARRSRRLDMNALRETIALAEVAGIWDVGAGWIEIVERSCGGRGSLA